MLIKINKCLSLLQTVHILLTKGKGGVYVNNFKCGAKLIGLTILAFGLGVLMSFFLPDGFLVVIEAVVIIGIGCLYFSLK